MSDIPLTEMDEQQALARFSRSRIAMVMSDPRQDDNPIVFVNTAFERMTGYSRSAAVGRNCRFLQGPDTEAKAVRKLREAIAAREEISVELLNYRADGTSFRNRVIVSPVHDGAQECAFFVGLQFDMGEADDAAEVIDRQLREVQHRVKNHLSMIIGMIRMQSRQSADAEEFSALARRIESLQFLYEEMSIVDGDSNRDVIPLGSYLSRIANAIAHIDGRAGIRVNVSIEPLDAPVHTATQLGLILSEIMTNAFQHAFEGRDTGLVEVHMTALSQGGLRLMVGDDGIGMPENLVWPKPDSLGGRIMAGLVEGLDGHMDISRGTAGTVITIDVPVLGPVEPS